VRDVFSRSNIYPCFKTGYGDLGLFGQSAGILVENDETTVRMMQLVHGRFWIARDENGRVNTLYRKFRWAVDRIIGRFGYNKVSPPILTNTLTAGDLYQNMGTGTIASLACRSPRTRPRRRVWASSWSLRRTVSMAKLTMHFRW
jgi:hypothetical protein